MTHERHTNKGPTNLSALLHRLLNIDDLSDLLLAILKQTKIYSQNSLLVKTWYKHKNPGLLQDKVENSRTF